MPVCIASPVAGLILWAASLGAAQAEVSVDVAQRLLQHSGHADFLAEVSPLVQSYLMAAVDTAPQSGVKRAHLLPLSQSLQKAYAPERLRAQVTATLARQLGPQEAEAMQAWWGTPDGQQVSAVERPRMAGQGTSGARLTGALRELEGVSAARRAMLADVVDTTGTSTLHTELLILSLQAIHRGTAGFMPQAAKVSAKDIKARLEAQRTALADAHRAAAIGLAVQDFAGLSDGQLQAYLAQLRSPAGEHWRLAVQQAISQAFKAATDEAQRTVEVGATAVPRGMSALPGQAGGSRSPD